MWTRRQPLIVGYPDGQVELIDLRYNASHQRGWRLFVGEFAQIGEDTPPTYSARRLADALSPLRATIEAEGGRLLQNVAARDCWTGDKDFDRFVRRFAPGAPQTELVDAFLPIPFDEAATMAEQAAAYAQWQESLEHRPPTPLVDKVNAGIAAANEAAQLARGDLARGRPALHHTATIAWSSADADGFRKGHYSRAHRWSFDGGAIVPASASPDVVRAPWSDPAGVDPEEAFLASIASCHMLWFLDLARHAGHAVTSYDDTAEAALVRSADGKVRIETVTLRPRIAFADPQPGADAVAALHHSAHEKCFIANSVSARIEVAS